MADVSLELIRRILEQVQEQGRRTTGQLARIAEDLNDIKIRTTNMDENMAVQNRRLDRIEQRLTRIERRLDLVEHE